MKTGITLTRLITLLLALIACVTSCSTPPGSPGVYRLKQTQFDVENAMNRLQIAQTAGAAITVQEQQQVQAAYAKYQAAYHDALRAAGGNNNAPAPTYIRNLAEQVISLVSSIP